MSDISEIDLPNFIDDRGSFQKLFHLDSEGLKDFHVNQINRVVTNEKHTLRGLHYQSGDYMESKLFRVVEGEIQLAAFCVNTNSNDYLKSFSFLLNSESQSILIPKGYATGYLTLMNNTEVIYCSDNEYKIEAECGICWNDPIIKTNWKIKNPILSEKDKNWPPYEC